MQLPLFITRSYGQLKAIYKKKMLLYIARNYILLSLFIT